MKNSTLIKNAKILITSPAKLNPPCALGTTATRHTDLIKKGYDAVSDTFIRGIYFSNAGISLPRRDAGGCTKFPFSMRFTTN